MREKIELFLKKHYGVLKAIGWFSTSMLKAIAWGYGLGAIADKCINKAKDKKSKVIVAVVSLVALLGVNKLLAWHEAEIVTPKIMEAVEEDEDSEI